MKRGLKLQVAPPARRLEYLPLSEVLPAPRNPKRHDASVGRSIERFGFLEPLVLDERTGRLVSGHGRLEALKAAQAAGRAPPEGIREEGTAWLVPVFRGWASRSDTEAEAALLAVNRLVEKGGWDEASLAPMLEELQRADALEAVGFDLDEVTRLVDSLAPEATPEELDEAPAPAAQPYVQPGQLYQLGPHRILCGDATRAEDVDRLMAGQLAHACWTDPPWNVDYGQNHPKYKKHEAIANDNLGSDFGPFCDAFCASIRRVTLPGAALYMAMSAQEWPVIHAALVAAGFHWSSTLIWAKDSLVLSRKDYHTQYEPIWYGWQGQAARLCPLEDRTQSDLWEIPRPKKSDEHPTMKPVALVARALRNSTRLGDVVFEPFSGSGTTLVACEETGRVCRAIELSPAYVQVAIERWEKQTGGKAELVP